MTEEIRFLCVDSHAPPLFDKSEGGVRRTGYEPDAAQLVADVLGRELRWVITPWAEMIPRLRAGEADGIWCGQGVTKERSKLVDFTRPYAVFDESVLVRAGSGVRGPEGLGGYRVAAIAGSTNLALARTFPGVTTVPFDGASVDVFGDMVAALRAGEVDAVVDDDVVTVPLGDDPDLDLAFTVPTRNRWAIAVAKDRPAIRAELDAALGTIIADGRLAKVWRNWMPALDFPVESTR
ncbi:MAG: substrate-binding periplasmic protein [Haloechinothrix sp.]